MMSLVVVTGDAGESGGSKSAIWLLAEPCNHIPEHLFDVVHKVSVDSLEAAITGSDMTVSYGDMSAALVTGQS